MRQLLYTLVVFLTVAAPVAAQSDSNVNGGNGTLYLGVLPPKILVIDEATLEVTGEIPVTVGIPRQFQLSPDRTRFYLVDATFLTVEILDIETRKTIDTFTLSEGNEYVRIRRYAVDPLNRFMILMARTATKQIDRWEIGPMELLQYDLSEHRVIRTIPWPDGEERERANMLFSPDGGLLYFFAEDVLIFETENFTQVDKWELSQSLEGGFTPLSFDFASDTFNEEPGFFTGLFQTHDPVRNRQTMGVARINLPEKSVDFYELGPQPHSSVSFTLAPGRKWAYGYMTYPFQNTAHAPMTDLIGRFELWTFDLENRRLHERRKIRSRPRMGIKTSTNGKLLYGYKAGNTVDVYDIASNTYVRRMEFDGDMMTNLIVVP